MASQSRVRDGLNTSVFTAVPASSWNWDEEADEEARCVRFSATEELADLDGGTVPMGVL
jgi:hypothetical protein